jgi:WD40 repeat protein
MKSTPAPSATGLSAQSLELSTPLFRVFDDRPFRGDSDLLALAFAGDGSLWAVEEPGVLRHWNTIGGRQLAWHYLSDLEMNWAFSDDARWLASGSDDLSLWDVSRGKLCAELAQPSWITAIAFSRDSALIATGHDDGMVRVWNIAGKRMICEFGGHKGAISALAFHPDGTPLATAAEQKVIRLWDVPSGVPRGTLTGHTDRIPALAWHPSGRHLYSAGWDTTVRVWDVAKREPVILLNSHATQVNTLTFNRAGTLLAAADSSKRIHLWDAANNQSVQVLTQIDCETRSLAFSPDGGQLASGGNDRVIHIWSRSADETGWRPAGGETRQASFDARTDVAISRDGARLASIGANGLRIWSIGADQPSSQPEDAHLVSALAFSPTTGILAGGCADTRLRLWDISTGRQQAVLEGQDAPITAVAFTPDGTLLATGGSAGADVWLWDVAKREPALVIPDAVNGCAVEALAFHPSDNLLAIGGIDWLATGGNDGRITLWDMDKRAARCTFAGGALKVAFHPKRQVLAAVSLTRSIRVWNMNTKRMARELTGSDEAFTCVAYSPDGRWLAAGDEGHALRLWDADGPTLRAFVELDSQIKALAFSPDGRYLFTGNGNSSCYQIEVQRLLDAGI